MVLDNKKVMKKINNLKVRVKNKSDVKKTGNKKVVLSSTEKHFLLLLDADVNPVITIGR